MTYYLYLITNGTAKTKIGISGDVEQRFKALQASSPRKLYIEAKVAYANAEQARCVEQALHQYFESRRLHYEWFTVTAGEVLVALETIIDTIEMPSDIDNNEKTTPKSTRNSILDEIYSINDVMEYTGLSKRGVKMSPFVKGVLWGHSRLYLKRELDAYLNKGEYEPEALYDEERPELGGYEAYILSQILDTQGACDYLGIARVTLQLATKEGLIKCKLLHSHKVIYLKDDLNNYEPPKQGRPFEPDAKWHGYHAKYKKGNLPE